MSKKVKLVDIELRVGVIVYGKIRGYPAWPAKIEDINGNNAKLNFFGDHSWYASDDFIIMKML